MQKTVIGSFDSYDEAQRVVDDLKSDGFMAGDISIVASNVRGAYGTSASDTTTPDDTSGAATGAVTGGVIGGAAGLAASLMGLAIPGIGPIIAAGPIVAALTGAGVGAVAGGLIGGLTDLGVSEEDAQYYAESVRRGGALVTLRADESRAERAADIMRNHGAVDIERRVETWRQTGWSGFDASAQPYTASDVERDRASYRTSGSTGSTTSGSTMSAGGSTTAASPGSGSTNVGTRGSGTAMGTGTSTSSGYGSSTGTGASSGTAMGSTGTSYGTTGSVAGAGTTGAYAASSTPRTSAEWDAYETDFRSDYEKNYAGRGGRYEDFQPAYRHGFESAGRYRGRQWNDVESDVQRDWESSNPSRNWQEFKNAARRGWDRMSDAIERATPGDSDRDGK